MEIVVKANGKIVNVNLLKKRINEIVRRKKHLCGSCQALVCPRNGKLFNEFVKIGMRTPERYYVFDCDGYKAKDENYYRRTTAEPKDGEVDAKYAKTYSIAHPAIRSMFN